MLVTAKVLLEYIMNAYNADLHRLLRGVMKLQVSFHPSGNFLASSSLDGSIKIFDLLEARPVFDLLGHEKPVTAVAFSPKTGSTIASGGKDSLVFLWQSNLKVGWENSTA